VFIRVSGDRASESRAIARFLEPHKICGFQIWIRSASDQRQIWITCSAKTSAIAANRVFFAYFLATCVASLINLARFVVSKADAQSHIIPHIMYSIVLINAQRSVFDRLSDLPSVFTCYACFRNESGRVQRFTFDTIERAEAAAKDYAYMRPDHKYMSLDPCLDIVEHARVNQGTTFVQIDFNSSL
jgi:hypothetical protein